MRVERQVRANEREQPGDLRGHAGAAGAEHRQELREALPFRVRLRRVRRIGASKIVFSDVRNVRRLPPIDGPGAKHEQPAQRLARGKFEHPASPVDDRRDRLVRGLGIQFGARVRRAVHAPVESTARKCEVAHVAGGVAHRR
jgi:hypothetical protein